jgi:hypothetical protein
MPDKSKLHDLSTLAFLEGAAGRAAQPGDGAAEHAAIQGPAEDLRAADQEGVTQDRLDIRSCIDTAANVALMPWPPCTTPLPAAPGSRRCPRPPDRAVRNRPPPDAFQVLL